MNATDCSTLLFLKLCLHYANGRTTGCTMYNGFNESCCIFIMFCHWRISRSEPGHSLLAGPWLSRSVGFIIPTCREACWGGIYRLLFVITVTAIMVYPGIWEGRIMETAEPIPTKFCTVVETTRYSSWVVQIHDRQIQDGGRTPSWKTETQPWAR